MAKKKSMPMGKMVMIILAIVCCIAICLPLFINVWNIVYTLGNSSTTTPILGEKVASGYFSDYSDIVTVFELYGGTFMAWASTIAGIALIAALIGAVAYIAGSIMQMVNGGNKTTKMLAKLGSIVMLVAGIVIVIASLMVVLPVAAKASSSVSASLGTGAWIGMIAPILAGVLGYMTCKK